MGEESGEWNDGRGMFYVGFVKSHISGGITLPSRTHTKYH